MFYGRGVFPALLSNKRLFIYTTPSELLFSVLTVPWTTAISMHLLTLCHLLSHWPKREDTRKKDSGEF
ncbi:hypothetical protein AB205_0053650 [Aquarana catesbeiana]|uniref:Uncharacterized protein n=1 Tax=Aquarana catesbeiana TaxID=8400 RepID=A0A2G9RKW8_AQUCT|nr:hypothetical protein AB205_0053650 [Aquarana catesbeiana]